MSSKEKRVITLVSSDGVRFNVENMMEDIGAENKRITIPLPNVNPRRPTPLQYWEAQFVKVDLPVLYELILAADYLDMKGLTNFICKNLAGMMKGKNAEQIRELFNIKNDYTPEEEEEVRRENQWAFEEYVEPPRVESEDENHVEPPVVDGNHGEPPVVVDGDHEEPPVVDENHEEHLW